MEYRYDYECNDEKCGILFEVEQKISDKPLKKCPACSKMTLDRVILQAPISFVKGDITTIGQLAERNAKKMGKEGVLEATRKQEADLVVEQQMNRIELQKNLPEGTKLVATAEEHKPWYGKLDNKTKKAIASDVSGKRGTKYIMEGK